MTMKNTISSILKKMLADKQSFVGAMKGSNFEKVFKWELESNGMSQVPNNKLSPENKKALKNIMLCDNIKNIPENERYNNPIAGVLHDGWFIEQPFGSQSYPDFIIAENGKVLAVEMKKVDKGGCPMWNGGLPRVNGLYIFMQLNPANITFFMGNTVISDERFEAMKGFFNTEVAELKRKYDEILAILGNNDRGFQLVPRAAYTQSGKEANYFNHKNRKDTETETIRQISNLGL